MTESIQQLDGLNDKDQQLLIDYLYSNLTPDAAQAFEKRLESEQVLTKALNEAMQLNAIAPAGGTPQVSEKHIEGLRWSLNKRLNKANSPVSQFFKNIAAMQVSFQTQLASMCLTFVLGYLLASNLNLVGNGSGLNDALIAETKKDNYSGSENSDVTSFSMQPVKMIKQGDFEVTSLSLDGVDAKTGQVNLTYSLSSRTDINGNLDSPEIQQLLAETLKNDVSDATRIQLVELFQTYAANQPIQDALSHSLLNDPNPGVRMAAAESLAQLASQKEVREILRIALAQDVNAGIRVTAFQALADYIEEKETQQIFKEFSTKDSNQYIRNQAKKLMTLQKKI